MKNPNYNTNNSIITEFCARVCVYHLQLQTVSLYEDSHYEVSLKTKRLF
jgi:hypothetical protein